MSDCDAVALLLAEGAAARSLPAPLAQHHRQCPACRRLSGVDASLAALPATRVAQGPALAAALDRDMAPVRFRTPLERALLPLGAVAAVLVSGATALGRPAAASPLPWAASALLLTLACAGLALVLYRARTGLGAPLAWRRGYLAAAAGAFGLSVLASTRAGAVAAAGASTAAHMGLSAANAVVDPHHEALGPMQNLGTCASTGSLFAAVVALAVLWSARRTVPVSSGSMGAVVGASAGLAAAAALQLSCASGAAHALAAHGVPAVAATVLCTFLGRRSLSP